MGGQRAESTGARITAQNLRGAVSWVEVYSKRAGQPPHQFWGQDESTARSYCGRGSMPGSPGMPVMGSPAMPGTAGGGAPGATTAATAGLAPVMGTYNREKESSVCTVLTHGEAG